MAGTLGGSSLRFVLNGQDLDGYIDGVQQFGAQPSTAVAFTLTNAGISFSVSTNTVTVGLTLGTLVSTNYAVGNTPIAPVTTAVNIALTGSVRVPNDSALWTNANGLITITGISDTQEVTTPAPTTNTYSDWAFVSVANAGTEALTTTGTFGSWTTTGAPATPNTQQFLNEIRSRTDVYTTSGIRHNESRICTADSCDGALTRVQNQPNTTRRPVVTESRNNVTTNTNFAATNPTISFTNTVTTFVRTGSLQLTWNTTAGTFPISTVTFADDHLAVSVSSTGSVTSTGAVGSIVTATVTDTAGNTGTDTITITAENHAAPTINVTPGSRSTLAAAGSGTAFSVATTGTDTTVTVAGENAGTLPTWLTVGANGSWSATANTGALRSAVIRFTVRDQLNQSAFEEVSVSQAAGVSVSCHMYTFTHGTSGLFGSNIGGYTLCDGTVITNRSLANPLTVCARDGSLTTVNGVWSSAGASCS